MLGLQPAAIINCAAYTQVDKAESGRGEVPSRQCHGRRAPGPGLRQTRLPALADQHRLYFRHGQRTGTAVREDDPPSPQGVYARTKWEGEQAARRHGKHLIVRTCGLYARPSDPRAVNFVRTMLRLGQSRPELRVVADQPARHLRAASGPGDCLSPRRATGRAAPWGTYHVTNTGQATWCEFAADIFRQAGKRVAIHPITTAEYGAPAARPRIACSTRRPITGWAARRCPFGRRLWPSILPS